MLRKLGVDIQYVAEWAVERCSVDFQVSYLRGKVLEHVLNVGILLSDLG